MPFLTSATRYALSVQAVLTATKRSLGDLRRRLGGRVTGFFTLDQPLFTTSLQLAVPSVICNPALSEIQAAVNTAAKKVRCW